MIDLGKRKRLWTELESEKSVEVKAAHIEDMVMEDKYVKSYYMRPHWARATIETPV